MNTEPDDLTRYLATDSRRPVPAELGTLLTALQESFGSSLAAVLFYGSCLRSGDARDGVVDLHVILDSYAAYDSWVLATLNRLLAPNVFYLACEHEGQDIRAKYNVFALDHLARLVGPGRPAVFSWARLAQRSALVYARDDATSERISQVRARAIRTFAHAAAPLCGDPQDAQRFWRKALELTFGSELRSESRDRARQLVELDPDYFEAIAAALPENRASGGQSLARLAWFGRGLVGKTGSVLRLFKGWYTFAGGLDYLVWKLERHSGKSIEVPERVRRWPAVYIWGFAWRLYRQGVFR